MVCSEAASEPAFGSVSANEMISSPLAMRGRYCCFCSSVPSIRMPCEPMPTLVPNTERKAKAVWPRS
ncbi:hypothetical protein D9M72_596290 [compost metagenome]